MAISQEHYCRVRKPERSIMQNASYSLWLASSKIISNKLKRPLQHEQVRTLLHAVAALARIKRVMICSDNRSD